MSKTKHSSTTTARSVPKGVKIWPADESMLHEPVPSPPMPPTLSESYYRLEAQFAEINCMADVLGSLVSSLDGEGSPTMLIEPCEGHFSYRLYHLVETAEGLAKNLHSIIDRLSRIV